jgi:hypothetical protein
MTEKLGGWNYMSQRARKLPLRLHLEAMRIAHSHTLDQVVALLRTDLELVDDWMKGEKLSLEELVLISRILRKWDHRTPDELSEEELELNRKIYEATNRLIDSGQYTKDDDDGISKH